MPSGGTGFSFAIVAEYLEVTRPKTFVPEIPPQESLPKFGGSFLRVFLTGDPSRQFAEVLFQVPGTSITSSRARQTSTSCQAVRLSAGDFSFCYLAQALAPVRLCLLRDEEQSSLGDDQSLSLTSSGPLNRPR